MFLSPYLITVVHEYSELLYLRTLGLWKTCWASCNYLSRDLFANNWMKWTIKKVLDKKICTSLGTGNFSVVHQYEFVDLILFLIIYKHARCTSNQTIIRPARFVFMLPLSIQDNHFFSVRITSTFTLLVKGYGRLATLPWNESKDNTNPIKQAFLSKT